MSDDEYLEPEFQAPGMIEASSDYISAMLAKARKDELEALAHKLSRASEQGLGGSIYDAIEAIYKRVEEITREELL